MCFRNDVLSEQHIVISGGCGAIGLGVIKKLTDHGAKVTINDIIGPTLAEKRLRDIGIDLKNVAYINADLTQEKGVEPLSSP